MKTLSFIALIAATATPALAEFSPERLSNGDIVERMPISDESKQR